MSRRWIRRLAAWRRYLDGHDITGERIQNAGTGLGWGAKQKHGIYMGQWRRSYVEQRKWIERREFVRI
jgi:hypothetical protein